MNASAIDVNPIQLLSYRILRVKNAQLDARKSYAPRQELKVSTRAEHLKRKTDLRPGCPWHRSVACSP